MFVYLNIECGNYHTTFSEMLEEAAELYDLNDDTNVISWTEYYKIIEI